MDTIELARVLARLREGDFRGDAANVVKDLLDDVLSARLLLAERMPTSMWGENAGVVRMLLSLTRETDVTHA